MRLIGAILLEQNDEWAVQPEHYMTLETIAPLSDDPTVSLPAIAADQSGPRRRTRCPTASYTTLGDTIARSPQRGTGTTSLDSPSCQRADQRQTTLASPKAGQSADDRVRSVSKSNIAPVQAAARAGWCHSQDGDRTRNANCQPIGCSTLWLRSSSWLNDLEVPPALKVRHPMLNGFPFPTAGARKRFNKPFAEDIIGCRRLCKPICCL